MAGHSGKWLCWLTRFLDRWEVAVLRIRSLCVYLRRYVSLIYINDGDGHVVVASSGGFDLAPNWLAKTEVDLEVKFDI